MKFLKFVLLNIFVCLFLTNCDSVGGVGGNLEPPQNKSSLPAPVLKSPTDEAKGQPVSPILSWKEIEGVSFYQIKISEDEDFSSILITDSTQSETYSLKGLSPEKTYYWKVRGVANPTDGSWSEPWSFSTVQEAETPDVDTTQTSPRADTAKPTVRASAPQNISAGDAVTITATANDASGISKIELYVEGSQVKVCTSTTTCSYSSSEYKSGAYAYHAVAVDASLNANSSQTETQYFTVKAGNEGKSTYKIMPLGDSITEAIGYRLPLWNMLAGEEYSINYVGSQSKPHPDLPDTDHEGHGGWTIGDISERVNGWLAEYHPDYVLLMIGTNDIAWWQDKSGAQVADLHAALVDQILANASPNTWVLVASIPPESSKIINPNNIDRAQLVRDFNREMEKRMQQRINNGKNVVFVDVYSSLTMAGISGDGVHPNSRGYRTIAETWFEKLLTVLP